MLNLLLAFTLGFLSASTVFALVWRFFVRIEAERGAVKLHLSPPGKSFGGRVTVADDLHDWRVEEGQKNA